MLGGAAVALATAAVVPISTAAAEPPAPAGVAALAAQLDDVELRFVGPEHRDAVCDVAIRFGNGLVAADGEVAAMAVPQRDAMFERLAALAVVAEGREVVDRYGEDLGPRILNDALGLYHVGLSRVPADAFA
jgi:hypothetical protein